MYLYFVLIKFVEFIHVSTRTRKIHYFSHLTGGVNSSLKGVHSTDISVKHVENVYHRTYTAKLAPYYLFQKVHGQKEYFTLIPHEPRHVISNNVAF